MAAIHLSLCSFSYARLFNACALCNQLFYFLVFPIRNCIKQSIVHLLIYTFLLEVSQLLSRQHFFMETINYL